ncbi:MULTISPECIES: phosphatidylinositol phosphate synthase [unclassified Aeromicrobium]|jgi:CDP-diacylglycerol--glycerol-3-phosphate 3-phosphatidyltransferase/CDP-diacylglycerol--inositol 3-phosphatidyltransferase|uniref:phosphatidylinositol phosphate synthase n=1 Tax=unclassified Aeromicrobium TaxID=2633570 RepID=UPI0006FEE0AE|nr:MULTISPECIES: CDP-alcohol phosphatidyltransferase family protein [unclassified Aeromicrobium]KQO38267.1 CDP-alcohol phosphatidyltransferase [Aeromicrobium sp. Leaf245]KQP24338.1 CDP-alcohol phosphatidyltransferase [Aeromicrobium sp. Leaf272]KQP76087.1 CDP-alcohol phosphatidyltransferase [Aeromicrobium sp. Leaf289]KQP80828.1 CDP-alcohol phosphatidyltransferase [Aeromicrobium sp. Leaf291]
MLERFRQFWTNIWSPLADLLLRLGVKPDHVTIVGTLGVSAGALWFFPRGQFFVGVMVVTAFVFSDLMDGYMARKSGQSSRWGAFLDSTLDRVGDAAVFGGLLLYYTRADADTTLGPADLYLGLSLACLVLGNLTSYARARAESLGMQAKGGIAERADRLVAILVMTGLNGLFGLPVLTEITLWALALASLVTVFQRMAIVHRQAFPPAGTES